MSLDELKKKIDAAQEKLEPQETMSKSSVDSMNKGMRILTEMIGIIVSSSFIGYGLDAWLGTSPGFLLAFIILGIAAFFYNLMKYVRK